MAAFWVLMAGAAVAAVIDWVAVGTSNRRVEYAAKPGVLVALTAAAASIPADQLDLVHRRWWFVAALVCCLAGDVLLMLPHDWFVPGLAAFLTGHVLFIVGLLQPAESNPPFTFSVTGLAVVAAVVIAAEAGPCTILVRSLVRQGQHALLVPVALYMVAIATMVILACNVANPWAAIGAGLFLVSDTVLALDRFVRPLPQGAVVVHVTYHLAQGLLVLSLVR